MLHHVFTSRCLMGLVVLMALAGCGADADQAATESSTAEQTPAKRQASVERLPVSLNAVMVAMVNQAADPIWVAAWRNPQTDADWRELERRAVQLELAGALLTVPGTGPLDDAWAGSSDWQRWSRQLRDVGASAARAAGDHDLEAIALAGDDLVEVCEGCHIQFKPNLPTGGQFGELSPTEEEFSDSPET